MGEAMAQMLGMLRRARLTRCHACGYAASRTRHAPGMVLLWVVPALWSTNYLIARLANGLIAPHPLALGRWSLAALLLMPWMGAALWRQRAALRREWSSCWCWASGHVHLRRLGLYRRAHHDGGEYRPDLRHHADDHRGGSARGCCTSACARAGSGWCWRWLGLLVVITHGNLANLLAVRFTPATCWILAAAASWTAYSVLLQRWPTRWGRANAWWPSSRAAWSCCCRRR